MFRRKENERDVIFKRENWKIPIIDAERYIFLDKKRKIHASQDTQNISTLRCIVEERQIIKDNKILKLFT